MSNLYQPSDSIKKFISKHEGYKDHWYKDNNGFWTIGYGHKKTSGDVINNKRISKQQGDALFQQDV